MSQECFSCFPSLPVSNPDPTLNLLVMFAYLRSLKNEHLIRGNWANFGFQVNEFLLAECVSFLMQKGNSLGMSRSELSVKYNILRKVT